jgi:hypothetical protein
VRGVVGDSSSQKGRPRVNVIHLRKQFFQFSGVPVSEPRWGKVWC